MKNRELLSKSDTHLSIGQKHKIETSVAEPERKEPSHFGEAGAGAATQCCSGSGSFGSGSKLDVQHRWIFKNLKTKISFLLRSLL
jgi:hypothetical protein